MPLPVPRRCAWCAPFDPPVTPYGPGTAASTSRRAPATVVRAAGAGVGALRRVRWPDAAWWCSLHPDGISTEYEPVRPAVVAGQAVVARGKLLGRVDGTHGAARRAGCLHWGARRAGSYLDPLPLLRPLGPVRLLPWPTVPLTGVATGRLRRAGGPGRRCWRSRSTDTCV